MSDKNNNDPLAGVLPLLFCILVGIIYQKREYILKVLDELLHKLMWLSLYLGIALLIGWVLYSAYELIKKKIIDLRQWITDVNLKLKKYEERLDSQRESLNKIRAWCNNHYDANKILEAQLAELKINFEPKKDAVQAEAAAKVEEAVQVVVEKTT
ncbi:MAG: hypothetical protein ACOYOK_01825 [Pseudobdellovibrionaceae bacterium]